MTKFNHKNNQNTNNNNKNKLEVIPIMDLYELANGLTRKSTVDEIAKNLEVAERKILHDGFYFQLVKSNESLDIYYIFEETVLSDYFYHISITRNDKRNYLSLTLYEDKNTNKKINNYQIGPFFSDNDGNIYNDTNKLLYKKNACQIKETISRLAGFQTIKETIGHLIILQTRYW